ncbi:hypothetical protein [Singulisphaera sp. GP187]|uniref:hypothetical protein n=1 Tax=Singulisphaera sp. GP187 TaxID=1882752 RepID=UPI0020B16B91|nr:hypothetical protein [Singulisphaera sp. GP187]
MKSSRREVGGGALIGLPIVWAQASSGTNANALALLSLRRWYSSLTLSSPESVPSLFGLWAWLLGMATLLIVVMAFQGPKRALGQLFDFPGHFRLIAGALIRLRRSGRVVAVTIGMTVLAWTVSQIRTYHLAQGKDDLILLTKSRGLGELAVEQGILAGLTPLRDLVGLADNFPLLLLATIVLFRVSAERWSGPYVPLSLRRDRQVVWGELVWGGGALYLLYRLVSLASGTGDLPLGGLIMVEVIIIPVLMLLLDAGLLSWVLVELRNAGLGDTGNDALDTNEVVRMLPGAMLTCLAVLPARYLATAVLLATLDMPGSVTNSLVGRYVRWQLNWGLADLQGAALVVAGVAGVVAWTRGTVGGTVRGYPRLLAAEGGHLAALLTLAGLAAGTLSALAYMIVLSLPAQTWVLAAADGYAHYATLPVGLVTLAGLVELGERSLPMATLASASEAGSDPTSA